MPTSWMIGGRTVAIAVWSAAPRNTAHEAATRSSVVRRLAPRPAASARWINRDGFVEAGERDAPQDVAGLSFRSGAAQLDAVHQWVAGADPGCDVYLLAGNRLARQQREVGGVQRGLDAPHLDVA